VGSPLAIDAAARDEREQQGKRAKQELREAKQALQDLRETLEHLTRTSVAAELAKLMLQPKRKFAALDHPVFAKLSEHGLLRRWATVPQKSSYMLDFYRRTLRTLETPPRRILEIGVKGGASLELWKALFPDAQVYGADIVPLTSRLSAGITVFVADQGQPETIAAIGERLGPFDLVIDDGSHLGRHQVTTLHALLPHLSPGALYVIEDIHTPRRTGDTLLMELATLAIGHFNSSPSCEPWTPPDTEAGRYAAAIMPRIRSVILDRHVLAFTTRPRKQRERPRSAHDDRLARLSREVLATPRGRNEMAVEQA
jgi:hypothetical protein